MTSTIKVDTISENTAANGVSIDGLTIKDGGIKGTGAQSLVVGSTDGTSARLVLDATNGDASGGDFPVITADGTSLSIVANNSGGNAFMTFQTNSGEDMRIGPNGKVGIGTASPTKALGIGGTGDISLEGSSNAIAFYDSAALKAYITSQSFGDHNGDGLGLVTSSAEPIKFFTNGSERMKIDSTGAVTMPLQPAFLASPAAEQTNLTNSTTLLFGTEVTDRNADYNAGTGTFTAPVTGLYQVGFSIRLQEVPIDATYVMVETVSSNRSFYYILDPGSFDENAAYWEFNGNYLIDMDANDTYFIRYIQSGGTTSTDMSTASYSFGTLAC